MSLLSEMKEHTAERRVMSNHPILSLPVNRDVREAYFEMLVFASFADNGKMDDEERVQLEKVGLALGMSSAEVNEITNNFTSIDDKGKVSHAAAAADALKGSGVANLLLCEFSAMTINSLPTLMTCQRMSRTIRPLSMRYAIILMRA